MDRWSTFAEFVTHLETTENYHALNDFVDGKWRSLTTKQVIEEAKLVALGLESMGIKKGDCIGLMALPSSRWTIICLGVVLAGAVLVPLFPNLSEENFIFEVKETGMKVMFVDTSTPIPIFEKHKDLIKTVVEMKEGMLQEGPLLYTTILSKGGTYGNEHPNAYGDMLKRQKPEDLATIVYTSATTGMPKGVELTHYNLLHHLRDHPFKINLNTRYLSILPLAHIFGFSLNLLILGASGSIYYFNDPKNIGKACQNVHPNLVVVVPRLLEKMYAKMQAAVQNAGFMKRHLGQWAFDLANQEEDSLVKYLVHPIVDKIVYSHLREALGGSLDGLISGGAALNPHLNHFFTEVGVPIYEGWGLTEACPVTVNGPGCNKIGTVGKPFTGIQIKTTQEGEVLVKGSAVMRGYHKNPEATAEALDSEGWLHTGDKGEIDKDGYLKLHGRFKEMYKTSTGEWVSPIPIEQEICKAPLIEMAMVIAEGRKFASCLLFANKEVLDSLKLSHGAANQSDEEFLHSEFVRGEMTRLFDKLNEHLNNWEQIRAYCFIPHPPSIEAGELTPSMKLRRSVIMEKYHQVINTLYPEEANV